ncbi:MAG: WecB/TagA/CpsF family glycosyltransferase [Oscillochloris sp.]|nr:WecB/TagA/CpsF family glycosyltransferase [Oscillochloris sp.]
MRRLLIILGVPVDALTFESALERIDEFVALGRKTGKSHQIATINADFVVNALHDPDLRHILRTADMTTADGAPVVWAARLLGVPLHDRVAGADLVPALAERAAQRGYSLYLLGGRPGVAERAAAILQQRNPGLQIAGIAAPPVSSVVEMDPAVLEDIRRAKPDMLLVAFGNPKQEKWINMYRADLGVPVCIGVGGTLDMIAGVTRRAPEWAQRNGMEWLFRLVQEPRRLWRRYVRDGLYFSWFFLRQWWQLSRSQPQVEAAPAVAETAVQQQRVLEVSGRLEAANLAEFQARAEASLQVSPLLMIDLSAATFLDSAALGALVDLTRRAREAGGDLWLCGVPTRIAQVIELLQLHTFFSSYPDLPTALAAAEAQPAAPAAPDPAEHGWTVIRSVRELDAYTVPAILPPLLESLERNPFLVLDLSEMLFLSSAGMAALVKLQRAAQQRGGEVRLAACPPDVRRSIELVRLDVLITLYESVAAAVAEAPVVESLTLAVNTQPVTPIRIAGRS